MKSPTLLLLTILLLSASSCTQEEDNRAAICAEMLVPLLSESAPGNQTTSVIQARRTRQIFEEVSLKLPDDVELRKQFEAVRHEYISTVEASGSLLELNNQMAILGQKSRVTNEDIEKWFQKAQTNLTELIKKLRAYD